jgi:hypothetical protein
MICTHYRANRRRHPSTPNFIGLSTFLKESDRAAAS